MTKVTMVIDVEYETRDSATANASVARITGDLRHQIEEGKMGHAMTGVVPGSVRVEIVKKSIA